MTTQKWDPNKLPEAVIANKSIAGVLKSLGMEISGGNRDTVKRYIARMGLDISHFTGQGHRKGSEQPVFERSALDEILVEDSTYTNTHRLKLRLISEGLKLHRCECCMLPDWLGREIPLELHHKNGVRSDHQISNLELLCPNCHAMTDNYRARNINERYTGNGINEAGEFSERFKMPTLSEASGTPEERAETTGEVESS